MSAQAPTEHIRELVASFLEANDLLPVVNVSYGGTFYGHDEILLEPRAEGAAGLVVQTAGEPDSYVISVFVAGEARPVEIAGPINRNTIRPFPTADEELLGILRSVASGEVFDELDDEGRVLGSDVPDPRTATGSQVTERRRWYKPWQ